MQNLISALFVYTGIVFVAIGVFGIYRFKSFYPRILVASKVDTVGYLTILIGVIIRKGFTFFSLKVFLIMLLMLIVNPLLTHAVARSAYFSGYRIRKE